MPARKQARSSRNKLPVTIDPSNPDAGNGGVIPPPEARWKPGESGNPNGRPKGAETSFAKIMEQELKRLVDGNPSLGDEGRICCRRRMVRTLLDAVEEGDARPDPCEVVPSTGLLT